jgi:hypothetical protein
MDSRLLTAGSDKIKDLAMKSVAHTISRMFGKVVAAGALPLVSGLRMK